MVYQKATAIVFYFHLVVVDLNNSLFMLSIVFYTELNVLHRTGTRFMTSILPKHKVWTTRMIEP